MINRKSQIGIRKSAGFTLVELLIVIGIITLLIGILLPVASKMRATAKAAVTQQLITTIEAAINQYATDNDGGFPGPFVDDHTTATWNMIGTTPLKFKDDSTTLAPTRSEELVLSLAGGIHVERAGGIVSVFQFDKDEIDRGSVKLGNKNRGRMPNFMASQKAHNDVTGTPQFGTDTVIPEFIDSFENPIIYVRALKGQTGTLAYYQPSTTDPTKIGDGLFYQELLRYVPAANIQDQIPLTYLQSDTLAGQARQQDRYILVSAGPDKKFGTADDITNFGSPKLQ